MCITKECEDPTAPGIWWRDDAEWKKYGVLQESCIRSHMTSKRTGRTSSLAKLGLVYSSKYPSGSRYVVDLGSMKQINLRTGFTRDIKVVNAPATAPTSAEFDRIKEELRACHQVLSDPLNYSVSSSCTY